MNGAPRLATSRPAPPRLAPVFGAVNLRGLWTLYWRGLGRHLAWWTESLVGPCVSSLIFLVVFVLARGGLADAVWPSIDLASFVAPGLVAFAFCHVAFSSTGINLLFDKMEGMVQDLLSAPLSSLELTLGWIFSAASAGLTTGGIVLLAFLPFVDWPAFDPVGFVVFALLGTLLFGVLGLLVGLWARKWDHYSAADSFLMLPLGLLSGTFFVRADLPPLGADILMANPVFHVVDGFRAALLGRADGDLALGAAYLCALILALSLLAWRLVHRGWHLKP